VKIIPHFDFGKKMSEKGLNIFEKIFILSGQGIFNINEIFDI